MFESDKDTRAASPLPATGDAPIPTQDGIESPALSFENKEYTAGPQARPSTPAVQPRQETPPEPKAEPKAEPKFTPRPITQLALLEPPKPKSTPRPQPAKAVEQQKEQQNRLRFRSLRDISPKPASLASGATYPTAGVPPSAPLRPPSGVTRRCCPTLSARDGIFT